MSDTLRGEGWWRDDDGHWFPPDALSPPMSYEAAAPDPPIAVGPRDRGRRRPPRVSTDRGSRRSARSWRWWSLAALAIGGVVCVLGSALVIAYLRGVSHLEATGVETHGQVVAVHGEGFEGQNVACFSYVDFDSRESACAIVHDPGLTPAGTAVTVLFDPQYPTHALIEGNIGDPLTAYSLVGLVGLPLLAFGLVGLAHSLDIRTEEQFRPLDLWLIPLVLLGAATWIAFAYVGIRARRALWVVWAGLYLTALVLAETIPRLLHASPTPSNLFVALIAVIWVGGMAHGMLVRDSVNHSRVVATEHRRPNRR